MVYYLCLNPMLCKEFNIIDFFSFLFFFENKNTPYTFLKMLNGEEGEGGQPMTPPEAPLPPKSAPGAFGIIWKCMSDLGPAINIPPNIKNIYFFNGSVSFGWFVSPSVI